MMKSELPAARRKKWAYRIFKGAAAAENRRTARAQKEFGTGSRQGCGGIIAAIFTVCLAELDMPCAT
jgi:hypothetical protein